MKYSFLIFLLFAVIGCGGVDADMLVGKWQASEILENGSALEIDLSPIGFEFSTDGFYHFTSTVNYEEAGTYCLRGPFLYTIDTLNTASSEKAVKITAITEDSLVLLMSLNGKDKIMKLFRAEN